MNELECVQILPKNFQCWLEEMHNQLKQKPSRDTVHNMLREKDILKTLPKCMEIYIYIYITIQYTLQGHANHKDNVSSKSYAKCSHMHKVCAKSYVIYCYQWQPYFL